jgi:1,4-alpha-glucan branching enzyme
VSSEPAAAPAPEPGPWLTDADLYLHAEGTHVRAYRKLGAHVVEHDGQRGVAFAVWAPNAAAVSVVGSFNGWRPEAHPMQARATSGVWECFVAGVAPGALYKFHIRSRVGGAVTIKADPYGFFMEQRPETASVVYDLGHRAWGDAEWMASRHERQRLDRPMSIYEVHAGSWRRGAEGRWLTWRELADTLVPYAVGMGHTHLELLPVSEHPFDGSWGYQTVGYYAPTSRFGTPDDFRGFVDAAHRAGLGVILDWVPAHFPKDAHGLGGFDGTHLYEHADPRKGQHRDWGTLIFNFNRGEVVSFLLSNALYWLDEYHVDGLRVDAVASMLYLDYSRQPGEWEPNRHGGRENLEAMAFLKRLNVVVHQEYPGVLTFAEESTAWPMVSRPVYVGGLGFDLKWNMGWMHDVLDYMRLDPAFRRFHHGKLTFSLMYAFTENFLLPFSHDEVVHGKHSMLMKMHGDPWRRFASLRALYGYLFGHPGKKLLFMGDEFGQVREWNHDAALDWDLLENARHQGLADWVRDLNRLHAAAPALHEQDHDPAGFEWIDVHDVDQSVVSFQRRGKADGAVVVVIANFTPVPRHDYRIGMPIAGAWREALNSDAKQYGGSGVVNTGVLPTEPVPRHGHAHSLALTLPPLAAVYLEPVPE